MKKIYLILFAISIITSLNVANGNNIIFKGITSTSAATLLIVPGAGPQWSPTLTTVALGDVVQFGLSSTHPANQVSQATWLANGTATLAGGFGSKNSSYQFTVTATTASTIFFVCPNHVGNPTPMKGMIVFPGGTTGLSAINNQLTQVSLFPNPAASEVNISVPSNLSDVSLKLIGINGQEIALTTSNQIFTNNSNSVLTAILPNSIGNGVYFIEVSTASERIYKKIVITK